MLEVAGQVEGPVYCRMLRGALPRLFPAGQRMRLGHARLLSDGGDIALLSSGICTEEALRSADLLRVRGVGLRHLHVTTLKPFDDPQILDACRSARMGVITMENHTRLGGLGTCVAELMADHGVAKRQIRLAVERHLPPGSQSQVLMARHGIDAAALVRAVEELADRSLDIDAEDLGTQRTGTYFSMSSRRLCRTLTARATLRRIGGCGRVEILHEHDQPIAGSKFVGAVPAGKEQGGLEAARCRRMRFARLRTAPHAGRATNGIRRELDGLGRASGTPAARTVARPRAHHSGHAAGSRLID